jgi:hypothetical protein
MIWKDPLPEPLLLADVIHDGAEKPQLQEELVAVTLIVTGPPTLSAAMEEGETM